MKPTSHDVYFARGNGIQSKNGNIEYRRLIRRKKKAYQLAKSKKLKQEIAQSITKYIKNQNRYFYYCCDCNSNSKKNSQEVTENAACKQQMDHSWVVVPENKLLTKVVKQALREKIKHGEENEEMKEDKSSMLLQQTNNSIKQQNRNSSNEETSSSSSLTFDHCTSSDLLETEFKSESECSSLNNEELENIIIINDHDVIPKPSYILAGGTRMDVVSSSVDKVSSPADHDCHHGTTIQHHEDLSPLTSCPPLPLLHTNYSYADHTPQEVVTPTPLPTTIAMSTRSEYIYTDSRGTLDVTYDGHDNQMSSSVESSRHICPVSPFEPIPFMISSPCTANIAPVPLSAQRNSAKQRHHQEEQSGILLPTTTAPLHSQIVNHHNDITSSTSIDDGDFLLDHLINCLGGEENIPWDHPCINDNLNDPPLVDETEVLDRVCI